MQTTIFEIEATQKTPTVFGNTEWGTFKDSLRAPVHGWFTYPAGFSYKAVEYSIKEANLIPGRSTIYDPFMGSGTTNIVARSLGYNSIGVEAHPFVFEITKSKMEWGIKSSDVSDALEFIRLAVKKTKAPNGLLKYLATKFPELILKCFIPETLFELLVIRDSIEQVKSLKTKYFLRTVIICTLRDVSIAATGWPYIAPNKIKITSKSKNAWDTFYKRCLKMYSDIEHIKKQAVNIKSTHQIILGDSRETDIIESESINHIFTSPPYLNNFDYADRTRLEMYFMGAANNWGDISKQVRTKLMTSATTQISRTDLKYNFLVDFKDECPDVYKFLQKSVSSLAEMRLIKGGKKSYDLMTIGYFNDIYRILKENYRVLSKGSKALYILGDSAPYGVHIPTDELIGKIGVDIGFKNYKIKELRVRGGKWAHNPQRHSVMLKESVVTLQK